MVGRRPAVLLAATAAAPRALTRICEVLAVVVARERLQPFPLEVVALGSNRAAVAAAAVRITLPPH